MHLDVYIGTALRLISTLGVFFWPVSHASNGSSSTRGTQSLHCLSNHFWKSRPDPRRTQGCTRVLEPSESAGYRLSHRFQTQQPALLHGKPWWCWAVLEISRPQLPYSDSERSRPLGPCDGLSHFPISPGLISWSNGCFGLGRAGSWGPRGLGRGFRANLRKSVGVLVYITQ